MKANVPTLALRRLGSSPSKHISSPGLGHSHSRYSHSLGISCSGIIFECGYDPEQQEEGCEGKGRWKEEGMKGYTERESAG
jgi:hypothetical protein